MFADEGSWPALPGTQEKTQEGEENRETSGASSELEKVENESQHQIPKRVVARPVVRRRRLSK